MMDKTIFVLVLIGMVFADRPKPNIYPPDPDYVRLCRSSFECGRGQCCRDRSGNLIGDTDALGFLGEVVGLRVGRCTRQPSRPGEVCSSGCGCTEGHECYRTITGACCPPTTCWTNEAAEADRKFWQNCRPPNCFLPPVAPPASGPI